MNMISRILGSIHILEVMLTADGYTIHSWYCKYNSTPQKIDWNPKMIAKHVVAITLAGSGVISKPITAVNIITRIQSDKETFIWSEYDGVFSFVRREKLCVLFKDLTDIGIYPQRYLVAVTPETAALIVGQSFHWKKLMYCTPEGSALTQVVIGRIKFPLLGFILFLLVINILLSSSLVSQRQTMQEELVLRERTHMKQGEIDSQNRELLESFSFLPKMSYTVVCDRIAAAVPATVKLTALEMGSFEERPEKGELLPNSRNVVSVCGEAKTSQALSDFIGYLSKDGLYDKVQLAEAKRSSNENLLFFKIVINL